MSTTSLIVLCFNSFTHILVVYFHVFYYGFSNAFEIQILLSIPLILSILFTQDSFAHVRLLHFSFYYNLRTPLKIYIHNHISCLGIFFFVQDSYKHVNVFSKLQRCEINLAYSFFLRCLKVFTTSFLAMAVPCKM